MTRPILLVIAVSSCGQVEPLDTIDAATPDVVESDAHDAATVACDVTAAFGPPVLIPELNDAVSNHAFLSPDRLTAYLDRSSDIYVATRNSVTEPFGAAAALAAINTTMYDGEPVISDDGLTVMFGRGNPEQIHFAVRATAATQFGPPALVANVNDPLQHTVPTDLDPTTTTLYLSRAVNGLLRLYVTQRTSASAAFGAPTPMVELTAGGTAEDYGAVITDDQLVIMWGSERAGSWDLFMATRTSVAQGFGVPTPLSELNTASAEWPTWLSSDGCQLMFASNRPGGEGAYDLYFASRPQ